MSFFKSPPADPLPLDVWVDQQDRDEVGRESFFRRRDREYDVLRKAVNSLREGFVGGGTLSIGDFQLITESVRGKTSQTLEDFLTKAPHVGLLAPARNSSSRYRIPIASLGDSLLALEEEPPPQFRK